MSMLLDMKPKLTFKDFMHFAYVSTAQILALVDAPKTSSI